MTVRDIITNPWRPDGHRERDIFPPESLFEVLNPHTGEKQLGCYANFKYTKHFLAVLERTSDILTWEVTKPHFTKEEHEALKKTREAKENGQAEAS